MSKSIAARRYAEALFQLGNEKGTLEQLSEELLTVQEVFQKNEQIYTFLKHPRVNNENKKQFLEEAFQGLQADVVNAVKLLVERQRIEITPIIIDHFNQMLNDAKGIAEAKVYSVRELSDSEKDELSRSFAKRIGKKGIKIENIVDPSLLGGLKIRVGNTIYDGSVSSKLNRIERNIVSANK
jgi:F-type H+-transporting ATPase subunit delta